MYDQIKMVDAGWTRASSAFQELAYDRGKRDRRRQLFQVKRSGLQGQRCAFSSQFCPFLLLDLGQ